MLVRGYILSETHSLQVLPLPLSLQVELWDASTAASPRLAALVCGFLNSGGGVIYCGVSRTGQLTPRPRRPCRWADWCCPLAAAPPWPASSPAWPPPCCAPAHRGGGGGGGVRGEGGGGGRK